MVLTAFSVFLCSFLTISSIDLVDMEDSSASFLMDSATTANPLPASPALAASMLAFKAKRLVCSAMEAMTLLACPMAPALSLVLYNIIYLFRSLAALLCNFI